MLNTSIPLSHVIAVLVTAKVAQTVVFACLNAMSPRVQVEALEDDIDIFETTLESVRGKKMLEDDTSQHMQRRLTSLQQDLVEYRVLIGGIISFRDEFMAVVKGLTLHIRRSRYEAGELCRETAWLGISDPQMASDYRRSMRAPARFR